MESLLLFKPLQILLQFDWQTFLWGEEKWDFLFEVALRTFVMFLVILTSLRLLGKRGIKQLSVFELGVIIALGSAAGDPMFYKDVGLVFGMLVLMVVVLLYRLLTYLTENSEKAERLIEGKPTYIISEGKFIHETMKNEPLSPNEIFAELRFHNVTHLGQIKIGIVEATGEVSAFFYEDEEVKPGLPILPHLYDHPVKHIKEEGQYACRQCGEVEHLLPVQEMACPTCGEKLWVKTIREKRIR